MRGTRWRARRPARATLSAVCVMLLGGGCRQNNPDWLGPASAEDEAGEDSTTAAATTGATTGAMTGATTGTPESTSGSGTMEAETGQISCSNDNQCPADLVCGPDFCQAGVEGDPCDRDQHCSEAAPNCGPMDVCQDGGVGDPCDGSGDCGPDAPVCGMAGCEA